MRTVLLVTLFAGLVTVGCIKDPSEPPARPHVAASIPTELTLTLEAAIGAVQRVSGAKAYSLSIESPESVYQDIPESAQAQMIVNGVSMRMTFERRAGQWQWIKTTSPIWSGQTKSPEEVIAWLVAHSPSVIR